MAGTAGILSWSLMRKLIDDSMLVVERGDMDQLTLIILDIQTSLP